MNSRYRYTYIRSDVWCDGSLVRMVDWHSGVSKSFQIIPGGTALALSISVVLGYSVRSCV